MATTDAGDFRGLSELSERELVERWVASQDREASRELYQRYIGRLLRHAGAERLRESQLSSAYFDAFGTFLRRAPNAEFKFDQDDWLWRLLGTIAARKRIEKYRQGIKTVNCGDQLAEISAIAGFEPASDEAAIYNDLREELLKKLTGREQIYLEMREEAYSRKEIADSLGVTLRQVRRIARSVESKAAKLFTQV